MSHRADSADQRIARKLRNWFGWEMTPIQAVAWLGKTGTFVTIGLLVAVAAILIYNPGLWMVIIVAEVSVLTVCLGMVLGVAMRDAMVKSEAVDDDEDDFGEAWKKRT